MRVKDNTAFFYVHRILFLPVWEVRKRIRIKFDSMDEPERVDMGTSLFFLRKRRAEFAASLMNEAMVVGSDLNGIREDNKWKYVWLNIPPEGEPVLVEDDNLDTEYSTRFVIAVYDVESHSWLTWHSGYQQWMIDFELRPVKWKSLQ